MLLVQITPIWSRLAHGDLLSLTKMVYQPKHLFSSWERIPVIHTIRALSFPTAEEMGIMLSEKVLVWVLTAQNEI